jgi:transposase-like protein
MQSPSKKTLDPVVSPLLIGTIHDQLREYDGMRVGDRQPCPSCNSTDLRKNGYQRAAKTFARLVTQEGFEEVGLEVQQYECKECGHSFQGDLSEYFYEGCEYAKPIVDLCRQHAVSNAYHACERILQQRYGLQIDRDTIKRYDERFEGPPEPGGTVAIGGQQISIPFLAFLFDEDIDEGQPIVLQSHTALW